MISKEKNHKDLLNSSNKIICSCDKELIPCYDKEGKRIGVNHITIEDEDWHLQFWSSKDIIYRIKYN